MPATSTSLANQLLVALPSLADPNFARSVALICQYDEDGAMGVVVNRPSEFTLGDVFEQMGIETDDDELAAQPVLAGGPVHAERGFVLHDGEKEWDRSEEHTSELQSLMRSSYAVFCLKKKKSHKS